MSVQAPVSLVCKPSIRALAQSYSSKSITFELSRCDDARRCIGFTKFGQRSADQKRERCSEGLEFASCLEAEKIEVQRQWEGGKKCDSFREGRGAADEGKGRYSTRRTAERSGGDSELD